METIPKRENLTIEFKSDRKRYPDAELVEEIVGMANTEGGTLYLGVEDDGTVTGLNESHQDATGLTSLIANRTVPSLPVRAEQIESDQYSVMVIEIPKSRTVIATATGKILRRRLKADGTPENIPMYPFEIMTRLSDLSLLDYSAQQVMDATPDDFDVLQIERLRRMIRSNHGDTTLLELSDEEILRALRFVSEQNQRPVPTVTGLIMIGKEESIRRLMPTVQADFQVLKGTKVAVNRSYVKPLVEMAELFEEHLKPWNPEQELEYGLLRIPVPAFSEQAYREALMNAFAHRDYTMLGRVRVEVSEEGLTISNPGGFIEGVSIDNLISAEPHGRNQLLSDAMKRIGMAEKTGRGIDRIYEGSIIYGRLWPDYSASTSNRVTLFIPRGKPDLSFTEMVTTYEQKKGTALSIYTLLVLSVLRQEKRIDIDRLAEATHISKGRIYTIVEGLHEDGLIEAFGSGRSRSFTLNRQYYRQAGREKEYVRQSGIDRIRYEEMILKLAHEQDGIITKRDVEELLHISASQAYQYLSKLVQEKKLMLANGGRYAKYRLM